MADSPKGESAFFYPHFLSWESYQSCSNRSRGGNFPEIATLQRGNTTDARLESGAPRRHNAGTVLLPQIAPRARLQLASLKITELAFESN